MTSKKKNSPIEFLTHKGELSHTRLISLIGSFIVFVMFCLNPLDGGIQNLMFGILAASLTNATISKFAKPKQEEYNEEDDWEYMKYDTETEYDRPPRRYKGRRY